MTEWQPASENILTRWAHDVSPDNVWTEYPRPQMVRDQWKNLNGLWDYAITSRNQSAQSNPVPEILEKPEFEGQILVPFGVESALSGVKRPLQPDEWLWYRRTFILPEDWTGQRILLHFGAVDWECTVWVNGQEIGNHRGGYVPFRFDITDHIQASENEILVRVWDPSDQSWIARGKQVLKPKGIWYTAVSGIWQTVWLEPVPDSYVNRIKLTPDIDTETLEITVDLEGPAGDFQVLAIANDRKQEIAAVSGPPETTLKLVIPNLKLWSPTQPFLYDLQIDIFQGDQHVDQVSSYFGMRKFSMEPNNKGQLRLCLNNEPLFHYGPLDQGYWPDGLHTPPSEAAMRFDVEFIQEIGCNMIRKHIKVEPARYYYDCDRLGMIVWQDMPNGGKPVSGLLSFLAIMFGKFTRRDTGMRWRAGRGKKESRDDYWRELQEMVDHLHNFVCIGMWVPFNEAWGQFNANKVAKWLKEYESTRPIDHASGWFDQGSGDFRSIHTYFKALNPEKPNQNRGVILSEFGGYALNIPEHIWNPDSAFGYRKYQTSAELTTAYIDLLENQLRPWIDLGLSGAVYTQTTDVEIEINGYLTYDREVVKMDSEKITNIHRRLFKE
jgi:beta-galactosidase/beta-glucuronidase